MNTNILQKCVEELKKETPNISYVLGMLETVIDMNGMPVSVPYSYPNPYMPNLGSAITNVPHVMPLSGSGLVSDLSDEEITARRYAGGPVGAI